MWLRWFPWRYLLSRMARSHGFIDPIAVLSRLRRFAQPSEVMEPIELLRAGLVFHARGLINTRSIQHNLNWVWPYWIERQFDPTDKAFVPRAFSITHVNLTNRNWTALGVPDLNWLPIVDPRGLLTPAYDRWSVDVWVIQEDRPPLLPSRADQARQHLSFEQGLAVETEVAEHGARLSQQAQVIWEAEGPSCRLRLAADAEAPGWLAVSLRPANPEGVSFIQRIQRTEEGRALQVDRGATVRFDRLPDRVCMSYYRRGDVLQRLGPEFAAEDIHCDVGLATAAALFRLTPGTARQIEVNIPLAGVRQFEPGLAATPPPPEPLSWDRALSGSCRLRIPDRHMQFLFDAAVRSLILHSPGEVYPGPYTYKRFWFRDAAFMLDALSVLGLHERVRRTLDKFPAQQTALGYFHSQEGEWDSNGEALWIIERYRRRSGEPLSPALLRAVQKGARWIRNKCLGEHLTAAHAGLLPAGFSAEHLGPNDYYYWDDFWSVAGLQAAQSTLAAQGGAHENHAREAQRLLRAIDRSIAQRSALRTRPGVPASPYRDMDSGAIGSLAASYPVQVWPAREPRLLETVEFLLDRCMVEGGFFQDMIHSGINPYLTLHLAQVLLRAGDRRHFALLQRVAELASPTGQWPEAIHPHTGGGCMGDGQHVWAAAEWVLMLRNCFVLEEGETLVLGAGIPSQWLREGERLMLGPSPTLHGPIRLEIRSQGAEAVLNWEADWHVEAPEIVVRLPGTRPLRVTSGATTARVVLPRTAVSSPAESP